MKTPIPWLRVLVEGVVIVGSILLAFGIQAWWDEVQERDEERVALLGLETDFTRLKALMEQREAREARRTQKIEFLYSLVGSPEEDLPVARVDSAFWEVIGAVTTDPGEGTLDGLINAGRLSLVQREALRDLLSGWKTTLDEVRDGEMVARDFVRESLIPRLSAAGLPIARTYHATRRDRPPGAVSDPEAARIYARVLSDPEARGLIAYRHNWAVLTLGEVEQAIEMIDQILALISEELAR